jgi:hypothetical protein
VTRLAALLTLILSSLAANAATPTQELARQILDAGLDPRACYHVRDLEFGREDIRIYLTEGYLIFGKPVDGEPVSAVFTGDIEGGDAEILVLPPSRSERLSLASFSGSPNLDEHFRSAAFIFSDDAYEQMMKAIAPGGALKLEAERGAALAANWEPVVRNLTEGFQVRILKNVIERNRSSAGFFYGALAGQRLGNFDLLYDPTAVEQIHVGQVVVRSGHAFFDLWTQFQARSFRSGARTPPPDDVVVSQYKIDATVGPDLKLQATTRAEVVPGPGGWHALEFEISPQMRVSEARIEGEPAEVFQPDSLRSSLILGEVNQPFLVIPAKPLEPGHKYEVEFKHSGMVVSDAGNGVYFVGARGSWYPNRFPQFARYDLTFHYPLELDLVATGRTIQQSVEGDMRVSRYRIDTPVRLAGFNLGNYEHRRVSRSGYTVDVYANRLIEPSLEPHKSILVLPPKMGQPGGRGLTVDLTPFPTQDPRKIKPAAHLEELAGEIAGSLEFMASHFGPPVLKTLTVSPIPGHFGQGFPGLIYLSTLAYLDPRYRPPAVQTEMQELFYSDIMCAHETAHQWWGNVVAAGTTEDAWLMEALANYSALLYLERIKDSRAVDQVLANYRAHLLMKGQDGHPIESAGPIIWGDRLISSRTPDAWQVITYEKGSWIMHMLRERIGEERFLDMLGELRKRYEYRTVTTDEFRKLAAEALPPKSVDPHLENFFDEWVYSTGIPTIRLTHQVHGKPPEVRVAGLVAQSDVPDDFSVWVPVEIQFPKGKPVVHWVKTLTGSTQFSVVVRQTPSKVVLDPHNSVLRK